MAMNWDGVKSALSSKRTSAVVAVASMGTAVGIGAFMVLPGASATPAGSVTICHRTASTSNPYVTNTVSTDSIDEVNNSYLNGHGDHTGPVFDPEDPQESWGDIIPPFQNDASGSTFPGRNWDADGQAWWSNGCAAPSESSSATTSSSETSESSTSQSASTATSTITTPASETSATGSQSSATGSSTSASGTSVAPGTSSGTTQSGSAAASTATGSAAGGTTRPPTGIGAGGGAMASTGKPTWLWLLAGLLALVGVTFGARLLSSTGKHQ